MLAYVLVAWISGVVVGGVFGALVMALCLESLRTPKPPLTQADKPPPWHVGTQ